MAVGALLHLLPVGNSAGTCGMQRLSVSACFSPRVLLFFYMRRIHSMDISRFSLKGARGFNKAAKFSSESSSWC
jgi:hypothetical protein